MRDYPWISDDDVDIEDLRHFLRPLDTVYREVCPVSSDVLVKYPSNLGWFVMIANARLDTGITLEQMAKLIFLGRKNQGLFKRPVPFVAGAKG